MTNKKEIMIDNIKSLYQQLTAKNKFIELAAKDLGLQPTYLRSHWFGNFWAIPESKQGRVVELLQKTISNQAIKQEA